MAKNTCPPMELKDTFDQITVLEKILQGPDMIIVAGTAGTPEEPHQKK